MLTLLLLAAQEQAFTEIREGQSRLLREPFDKVIRSKEAWEELWKKLDPDSGARKPLLPEVDFAKESVLAIAWGERPSAGWDLEVKSIRVEGGEAVVEVVRRPPTGVPLAVITYPYVLVKTSKLPGKVRFVDVPPAVK